MTSKHPSFSTLLAQKADLKMRRIRTSIFRRNSRLPVVKTVSESRRLMDDHDAPDYDSHPERGSGHPDAAKAEQTVLPVQDEAHIFALRHLSRALTTLERGILRLEHLGLYIDAFGLRKLWHQLLSDVVKANAYVGYEAAAHNFDSEETRAQHLEVALDEVGMALVMAEATMARWSWMHVIGELRREIVGLHERFGRRMPDADDPILL